MNNSTPISPIRQDKSIVASAPPPSKVSRTKSKSTKKHSSPSAALANMKSAAGTNAKSSKAPKDVSEKEDKSKPKKIAFKETPDGLIAEIIAGNRKRTVFVSSPFKIEARSSDKDGTGWAIFLGFCDPDGKVHRVHIAFSRIETDPGGVRALLRDHGLQLGSTRDAKELFFEYLVTKPTDTRLESVNRVGWHGNRFVLSNDLIGDKSRAILLQAPENTDYRTEIQGTLEEWRERVGSRCAGNSRLIFGISTAAASALLGPLGEESGGVHLRGESSTGKSTILFVDGSYWGSGGQQGFVRSWLSTKNAIEILAQAHNDQLLLLDELALIDPKDVGDIIYIVSSGACQEL